LNAATTARERETVLNYTKTDRVDLMAIVQSLLHGRGGTSVESILELGIVKDIDKVQTNACERTNKDHQSPAFVY